MCKYCKAVYDEYGEMERFFFPTIKIGGEEVFGYCTVLDEQDGKPVLMTYVDNLFGHELDIATYPIRYCPICGKDLVKAIAEEKTNIGKD